MNTARNCPSCQKPLPADAPEGLCPECLVQVALGTGVNPHGTPSTAPTKASPAVGISFSDDPAPLADIAKLFPQLEILEVLGQGGMGVVYKARQKQLDRLVALKIMLPQFSRDPAFVERFNREARALAKLNHPNIVAVYDFGQTSAPQPETRNPKPETPLCYFIMEFVDGANLRQLIQARKLTATEALAIVPKLCDALQFAHDEGVVHRDIKPANILIDKKGRVKIADFGLAKLAGTSDFSLTRSQQGMGTPQYMAPEQLENAKSVDHRADIYSLGVVFYEMLTGELPLGRFASPSQCVQIDVRLDEIVLKALERQPDRRYQQASEVRTQLESVTNSPACAPASPATPAAAPRPNTAATPLEVTDKIKAGGLLMVIAGVAVALFGLIAFVYGAVVAFQYANQTGNPGDAASRAVAGAFVMLGQALSGIAVIVGGSAMRKLRFHGYALAMSVVLIVLMPAVLIVMGKANQRELVVLQHAFSLYVGIKCFRLLRKPEVEAAFAGSVNASKAEVENAATEPRLSRHALVGAIWAALGLCAAIALVIGYTAYRTPSGSVMRPPDWFLAFAVVLGIVVTSAVFGAPILGGIAIAQIKRSAGKLYGLPLALGCAVIFPLLLLAGVVAYSSGHALAPTALNAQYPETIAALTLLVPLVAAFFLGLAAWLNIAGPPTPTSGANPVDQGSAPGQPNFRQQDAREILTVVMTVLLGLSGLGVLAGIIGLARVLFPALRTDMVIGTTDSLGRDAFQFAGILIISLLALFLLPKARSQGRDRLARINAANLVIVGALLTVACGRHWFGLAVPYWAGGFYALAAFVCWIILRGREVKAAFASRGSEVKPGTDADQREPRLSRCALLGALAVVAGVFEGIVWAAWNYFYHLSPTPASDVLTAQVRTFAYYNFHPWVITVAIVAPFIATILGALAIAQINRSGGKLYGLRLAAADALFFPLLILGAAAFGLTHLAQLALRGIIHTGNAPGTADAPTMMFMVLDSIAALIVCFFAARAAWRKIAGTETTVAAKPFTGSTGHLVLNILLSVFTLWFLLEFGFPVAQMITGPDLRLLEVGRQWHLGTTVDSIFSKLAALAVLLAVGNFFAWRSFRQATKGAEAATAPGDAKPSELHAKLQLVGIGLLLAGIADAFAGLLWTGQNVHRVVEAVQQGRPIGWLVAETLLSAGTIFVVYYVVGAGLFLMRRNDEGDITFPLIIAALVPPGFFVGLPAAIYAFVLLSKPEVKALFPQNDQKAGSSEPAGKAAVEANAASSSVVASKQPARHLLSAFLVLLVIAGFFFGLSFQAKHSGTAAGMTKIITVGALDPLYVSESGPSGFNTSLNFFSWSFFAVVVCGIAFGALWRIGREDQGKVPRDPAWWRDWWKQVGIWGGLLLTVCVARTVMHPEKVLQAPGSRAVDSRFAKSSQAPAEKSVAYLDGHTSIVKAVAVSPDGRTLVSAGMDGRVITRELPAGKLGTITIINNRSGPNTAPLAQLRSMVISSDGRRAILGGDMRDLQSVDLSSRQIATLRVPNETSATIDKLMVLGPNKIAYLTIRDEEIVFFDTDQQRTVAKAPINPGQSSHVGRAVASPDGKFIALTTARLVPNPSDPAIFESTAPHKVSIHDATGTERRSVQLDATEFLGAQIAFPDARTLVVCLPTGRMLRWKLDDAGNWNDADAVRIAPGRYTACAASRDGKVIWLAESNQITGIDSTTGKGVAFVELKIGQRLGNFAGSAIDQIAATAEPRTIAAALWDGRVALAKCWPLDGDATKPAASNEPPKQPFMIGLTGPELTNEAIKKLNLSKLQTDEINRTVLTYHREYLALQRRHSTVGKDATGRILVTIAPFPDECLALAKRLQTELGGIVDPALLPVINKGELAFQIFSWGGAYNATITLWKADGKYHVEEKLTGTPAHPRDPFTFNLSGPKLEEIPESFRIFWREQ